MSHIIHACSISLSLSLFSFIRVHNYTRKKNVKPKQNRNQNRKTKPKINQKFCSRLNSSGAWRHSMTRDLGTDIDSVFSSRTGATLPKGEYSSTFSTSPFQLQNFNRIFSIIFVFVRFRWAFCFLAEKKKTCEQKIKTTTQIC